MTKSFIIELFSPYVGTSHVFWISLAEFLGPLCKLTSSGQGW